MVDHNCNKYKLSIIPIVSCSGMKMSRTKDSYIQDYKRHLSHFVFDRVKIIALKNLLIYFQNHTARIITVIPREILFLLHNFSFCPTPEWTQQVDSSQDKCSMCIPSTI
jgi:hypothetical protein